MQSVDMDESSAPVALYGPVHLVQVDLRQLVHAYLHDSSQAARETANGSQLLLDSQLKHMSSKSVNSWRGS